MKPFSLLFRNVLLAAVVINLFSVEPPKAPVPQSPFIPIVYGYADAMLKSGRDSFGPEKTGVFLSALDRVALAPLTNRPPSPVGIPPANRLGSGGEPMAVANPQHDQNLLRLLYLLSELSAKPLYRAAADAELKWFLEHAVSTNADRVPWGVNVGWDVIKDSPVPHDARSLQPEFLRPWMLWDRCFEVAPAASRRLAFDLLAASGFRGGSRRSPNESLRNAGVFIRSCAVAYARTKDERFLKAVETAALYFADMLEPQSAVGSPGFPSTSLLSLAIDCDGAAHRVPDPAAGQLRRLAARVDELFCALPHELKKQGGFQIGGSQPERGEGASPLWKPGAPGGTTAQIGMMCVSRYDNSANLSYRELLLAAADAYLNSVPEKTEDVWPATFGHAISLQLAAWRHTANPAYFTSARKLGQFAVEAFWGAQKLPRASLQTDHYEALTGGATLALALAELHLQILHITAVRCPPNTIDR